MGYYLETAAIHGKAKTLIDVHDAKQVREPLTPPEGKVLVCVINNGPFEAAAVIYSQDELEEFASPDDHRPKQWLLLDIDAARALCPDALPAELEEWVA